MQIPQDVMYSSLARILFCTVMRNIRELCVFVNVIALNSAICMLSKQNNVAARQNYTKGYSKFINVNWLFKEIYNDRYWRGCYSVGIANLSANVRSAQTDVNAIFSVRWNNIINNILILNELFNYVTVSSRI